MKIINLRLFFEKRKREKRAFNVVKDYLKTGFYYFSYREKIIRKIRTKEFFSKIIFSTFFNFSKTNGNATTKKFTSGFGKYVFINENICLCVPYTNELYYFAKKNYVKNAPFLSYPMAKIINFNDSRCYFEMEKIDGVRFFNREHDLIVLEVMLKQALILPVDYSNKTMLQHSDAKRNNVIWKDDKTFVFIDLDGISYYPILFDYIHYASSIIVNIDDFMSLLQNHYSLISNVLSRFGIDYKGIRSLDIVFYNYVLWYKTNCESLTDDYLFLSKLDKTLFPNTNHLFIDKTY